VDVTYNWLGKKSSAEIDESCSFQPIPIHMYLCPSPSHISLEGKEGNEEEHINEWISFLRIQLLKHKPLVDGGSRSEAALGTYYCRRLKAALFSLKPSFRTRVLGELAYELLELGIYPDAYRLTEHLRMHSQAEEV